MRNEMRVLLCDDHAMFAEAFASLLCRHGVDVITCNDPLQAANLASDRDIDLCLMDLNFGGHASGIDGVRAIKRNKPQTQVAVLSARATHESIVAARDAGAIGILSKADDADHVIRSIVGLLENGRLVPARPTEQPSTARPKRHANRSPLDFLTQREREVLELIVDGQSTPRIAEHLGISYATARSHVQRILNKLGVHSRLEAVALATSEGINGYQRRSNKGHTR